MDHDSYASTALVDPRPGPADPVEADEATGRV
jgi:hypothetical protein